MNNITAPKKENGKLNSKVGRTLTYKEFVNMISKLPIRIKALI